CAVPLQVHHAPLLLGRVILCTWAQRWPNSMREVGRLNPTQLALLQLQLALVFFNKRLKIGNSVEQPCPLLVVEGHWKAAQSVHADAALLAHAELYGAGSLLRFHLLFQIGQARLCNSAERRGARSSCSLTQEMRSPRSSAATSLSVKIISL